MSYLPGVPDMGPAPVSPTIKTPSSLGVGRPHGIAAVAHTVGKPGRTQDLGSVVGRTGKGISTLTGGDPLAHSMNHYGKAAPPALLGGSQMTGGVDPTEHAGVKQVRGGSGGIRANPRTGGIGPGKMSTPGPSNTNYSMNSSDVE